MAYMHDQGIIHGDPKGVRVSKPSSGNPTHGLPSSQINILINNQGHACLAGFSLLTIVSDQSSPISSSPGSGTLQWMSPELLDPDRFGLKSNNATKESDCYALGMLAYEILSGQTPFAPATVPVIVWMVLEGKRPGRPQGEEGKLFTDAIWRVLNLCWNHQPSERPSIEAVLLCLERARPPSGIDEDKGKNGNRQTRAAEKDSRMFSPFHPRVAFIHPRGSQNHRLYMVVIIARFHRTIVFLVRRVQQFHRMEVSPQAH